MFTTMLTTPNMIIAAALAAALLSGGFYMKGRSDGKALVEAAVEAEKVKWERAVMVAQADTDAKTNQITADFNKKASVYKAELDKLKKAKPGEPIIVQSYIPQKVDVYVPNGFVDLHNRAAAGSYLEPAPKPNAAEPSDKRLALVGSTVAENYYSCNAYITQLDTLQEIVKNFQKKQKELIK